MSTEHTPDPAAQTGSEGPQTAGDEIGGPGRTDGTTERVRRRVQLDPESLDDCLSLANALYAESGVEHDPAAIRDALRSLRGHR